MSDKMPEGLTERERTLWITIKNLDALPKGISHGTCLDIYSVLRETAAFRNELEVMKIEEEESAKWTRSIINGGCPPEQHHCACVPRLRKHIQDVEKELNKLKKMIAGAVTRLKDGYDETIRATSAKEEAECGANAIYWALVELDANEAHKKALGDNNARKS